MNQFQFPPKTILVPVDFSELSIKAWNHALRLAQTFQSAVEAVYVAPIFIGPEMVLPKPLSARERRELKRTMSKTFPNASGLNVQEGDVLLGILRTASRRRADMIVMATGGRTGLKRIMVPSVAEEVVRSSPIPVLAVHGETPAVQSVLAPVNLQPYSLAALRFADKVARALDSTLSIICVKEGKEPSPLLRRRVQLAVEDLRSPVKTDARIIMGKPLDKILEEAQKHGIVVMAAHRKGFFHDAVLGSTAEQVLRRVHVPVLIVPPPLIFGRPSRAVHREAKPAIRRSSSRTRRGSRNSRRP